jgi:hypothetical protein
MNSPITEIRRIREYRNLSRFVSPLVDQSRHYVAMIIQFCTIFACTFTGAVESVEYTAYEPDEWEEEDMLTHEIHNVNGILRDVGDALEELEEKEAALTAKLSTPSNHSEWIQNTQLKLDIGAIQIRRNKLQDLHDQSVVHIDNERALLPVKRAARELRRQRALENESAEYPFMSYERLSWEYDEDHQVEDELELRDFMPWQELVDLLVGPLEEFSYDFPWKKFSQDELDAMLLEKFGEKAMTYDRVLDLENQDFLYETYQEAAFQAAQLATTRTTYLATRDPWITV